MTTTPIIGITEMEESQSSKYETFNEAIQALEGALIRVLDKDLTAPPGGESDGDCYIVGASATGDWNGEDENIAHYSNGGYIFYTPAEGLRVWVNDEDTLYVYDGSDWQPWIWQNSLALLAKGVTVDLKNGDGKSTIYTVPAGKSMIINHVVIRAPTASLASGNDFTLGAGASCATPTWRGSVNLSTLTATTHYMVITNDDTVSTIFAAADVFGIIPVTGAALDAQATADLLGYLF